jgi:hypothetical protein
MGGMNIYTVLVKGWLPMPAMAKSRVGLKSLSGYRGVTFAKGLTDKELRVLSVLKRRQK